MLLQPHFPFLVFKQKTISSNKNSYFLHLLPAFWKIFVFNDSQIIEGEK